MLTFVVKVEGEKLAKNIKELKSKIKKTVPGTQWHSMTKKILKLGHRNLKRRVFQE